ncbi:Ribosomal protein S7, mitochondrial [Ananas comosus]|uniref:Ribosomal protein S7 n=2 Tax=Petrosaviidae TaxID=1437197 RepID=A0A199V786_ANACO|nr:Ribosomal protein S7, mitochondrial [Ananas comosus]
MHESSRDILEIAGIQKSRALEKRDEQILLQRELLSVLETSSSSIRTRFVMEGKRGQKELIKKLVNFRMIDGKRTRVRAIVYKTFHRPARTERDVIKLMVDAVDNIKPICEVVKVGVAGTIYDVPGIVARDRQQTLAIRWILGAAFKRRISYRISLEKCSFAEILDAYRKRGIARKRRENLHGLASTNRSFAHFRWW